LWTWIFSTAIDLFSHRGLRWLGSGLYLVHDSLETGTRVKPWLNSRSCMSSMLAS
jgi:hypothetical protein